MEENTVPPNNTVKNAIPEASIPFSSIGWKGMALTTWLVEVLATIKPVTKVNPPVAINPVLAFFLFL